MSLERRQWAGAEPPIRFPGWRIWEDRRVRADNNAMALFAAIDIAKASTIERKADGTRFVSELYSDDEMQFRGAFRLTPEEAFSRWDKGYEDLVRMAIVVAVAALDDLLGSAIQLLRATGHYHTVPGDTDGGVSARLGHLQKYGGLKIERDVFRLHELLLQVRHAVTHHGVRQRAVRRAWDALGPNLQQWWTEAGGRAFPLTGDTDELRVNDREFLAALKSLDRISLAVADGLRTVVNSAEWAVLVRAEYGAVNPHKSTDPGLRDRAITNHARIAWTIDLTPKDVTACLQTPITDEIKAVVLPLILA